MPNAIDRGDFSRFWVPSADAQGAPPNGLLRADNLVPDEMGLPALRRSRTLVHSSSVYGSTVRGIHTLEIEGTKHRMVWAGFALWDGSTHIETFAAGTEQDAAFATYLGHAFVGNNSRNVKYNGSTLSLWGIRKPSTAPTVVAATALTASVATFNSAEAPAFVANEGTINATFPTGSDGTANGALELTPASGTGRGTITKTFASDQNFSTIAGEPESALDIFDFMVWISQPEKVETITVMFGCDTASDAFQETYYYFDFKLGGFRQTVVDIITEDVYEQAIRDKINKDEENGVVRARPVDTERLAERIQLRREVRRRERKDMATNPGWTHLSVTRGQFNRVGGQAGSKRNWSTIRGFKVVYKATEGSSGAVRFDNAVIIGGGESKAFTGNFQFKYIWVKDWGTGKYVEKSNGSNASAEVEFVGQQPQITIPAAEIAARDPHADTVWVYAYGGPLDRYYRVAQSSAAASFDTSFGLDDLTPISTTMSMTYLTGMASGDMRIPATPPTGLTINISKSAIDALVEEEVLEESDVPPTGIIGAVLWLEADRLAVLTNDGKLHFSQPRVPTSFDREIAIQVGSVSEKPMWVVAANEGLYVGTDHDVYRIGGDGAVNGDGTVNIFKKALNIGDPPIDRFVAQEGNFLVYRTRNGYRELTGESYKSMPMADVQLLWDGQTRHGVSPVNVDSSARFRGVLSNGIMSVITPEGASSGSSDILHRYDLRFQRWMRHSYPGDAWTSIHQEPDGVILIGGSTGLYVLDDGYADLVGVEMWTKEDDDGAPFHRKDAFDLLVDSEFGGSSHVVNASLYLDGVLEAPRTLGSGLYKAQVSGDPFRRAQLRVVGTNLTSFRFRRFGLAYRKRPRTRMYVDTGYIPISQEHLKWGSMVRVQMWAEDDVICRVYTDDVLRQTTTIVVTPGVVETYRVRLGRDCFGANPRIVLESTTTPVIGEVGFEPYWLDLISAHSGNVTQKPMTRIKFEGDE